MIVFLSLIVVDIRYGKSYEKMLCIRHGWLHNICLLIRQIRESWRIPVMAHIVIQILIRDWPSTRKRSFMRQVDISHPRGPDSASVLDGHHSDVTWASLSLKSPAIRLFVHQLVQNNNKDNIYILLALYEGNPPVTGGFPSQRVNNEGSFHVRTSSYVIMLRHLKHRQICILYPIKYAHDIVQMCLSRARDVWRCYSFNLLGSNHPFLRNMLYINPTLHGVAFGELYDYPSTRKLLKKMVKSTGNNP